MVMVDVLLLTTRVVTHVLDSIAFAGSAPGGPCADCGCRGRDEADREDPPACFFVCGVFSALRKCVWKCSKRASRTCDELREWRRSNRGGGEDSDEEAQVSRKQRQGDDVVEAARVPIGPDDDAAATAQSRPSTSENRPSLPKVPAGQKPGATKPGILRPADGATNNVNNNNVQKTTP